MGVKEIIANWNDKRNEKKKRFREMEEEFLMQKRLEEKQKSANERELERFIKERREQRIKNDLERFRKQKKEEFWHGHQILSKGSPILMNERPILKERDVIGLFQKSNQFEGGWGW